MTRNDKVEIITDFIVQALKGNEYEETKADVENWPDHCIDNEVYTLLDCDNI